MIAENLESQVSHIVQQIADLDQSDTLQLEALRTELSKLMGVKWETEEFRILISGIQPGTGSTTTKNLLNKVLGSPTFYDSGFYRRVIAQYWKAYAQSNGGATKENWDTFEQQFTDNGIGTLQVAISNANPKTFSDEILLALNEDQARFASDEKIWDSLPDRFAFDEANGENRGVWQGKLTALIDVILREKFHSLSIPIFRVLLTIDPAIAAARVSQREDKEDIERVRRENEERRIRDWDAFHKLYGIGPDAFDALEDLIRIDTSHLKPAEVTAKILVEMGKRKRD
jgi:cytidylate kinase